MERLAGFYDKEALYPPGIVNIASICYSSSLFQCLLNHRVFQEVIAEIVKEHTSSSCPCRRGNIIMTTCLCLTGSYELQISHVFCRG